MHATDGLALAIEAVLICLVAAPLGVALTRWSRLAALLLAEALAAILAALLLGLATPCSAPARLLMAALLCAAVAVGRACRCALGDEALAVTAAVGLLLLVVFAPVFGEAVASERHDLAASVRTFCLAASPIFAAAASPSELLQLPQLYGRMPAVVMEVHMVAWGWTLIGWVCLASLMLVASRGRRLAARLVRGATLTLLLGPGLVACNKDAPSAPAPALTSPAPMSAPGLDKAAVRAAIGRGVEFLLGSRAADGSVGGHPGVTGLALWAVARAPGGPGKDDPRVKTMTASLVKLAKPDGAIVAGDFATYTTALAVLAFKALDVEPELVKKGQAWLADHQFSQSTGTKPEDVNYGGIGYGGSGNADLSNLHFALEALHETQLKGRPEVYERARKFIERCQNRSESNDQKWAGNDGGFVYRPGVSKAGETKSSASMTWAGLKSFIYADVGRNDGRVRDAYAWLQANYSIDENPGLGQKGLFYYYHVMARALTLLGERSVKDRQGVTHDWYAELAHKLLALQRADGSWVNPDGTYWEDNPAVATPRALLALAIGLPADG